MQNVSEFYEIHFKQYAFNEREVGDESHEEIIFVIWSLLTKKWIFPKLGNKQRKFNKALQSTLLRFSKKSFEKLFKDKYCISQKYWDKKSKKIETYKKNFKK